MSKTKIEKNKNKPSEDLTIEKMVDEIILKNKEKLDKIYNKKINHNKFFLKNRDGETISYLKKTSKKKGEDLKRISGKIVSDARTNLGEEPVKDEEYYDDIDLDGKRKKNKGRLKFKRRERKNAKDEDNTVPPDVEEVTDSEEFDKIVSDIKKITVTDVNEIVDENAKELDKKIKKSTEKEKKVNKKTPSDEKTIDDYKEKYDDSIKVSSFETSNDTKDKDEVELLDKKIKETSLAKIVNKKPDTSSLKTEIIPRFETYTDRKDIKKDAKLLDEKIKETPVDEKHKENPNVGQLKVVRLVEEHVKEQPKSPFEKSYTSEKKSDESSKSLTVSATKKDMEHEHVFFDEDDSFSGWSPHISEKEKKEIYSSETNVIDESDGLDEVRDIELTKEVLSSKSVKLSDLGFSEEEWEELDFYPLHEPFAYVEILRERDSLEKSYFLVEVELTEEEKETFAFISDTIRSATFNTEELEMKGDDEYLLTKVNQVIQGYNIQLSEDALNRILYFFGKSSLGLGKIDPLMKDPNIEDISCDGSDVPLFLYHRKYGSLRSNIRFNDEEELSAFVHRLAQKCGKHISISEPMLDATMPDGSRIQMTLSDEITAKGSTFTIRKFRADPFSPPDLVKFNTMSSEMLAYMWLAFENGINILFAGGTASGKTTALNALSLFIPRESKIVSIEETREINLPHPNWIPGVSRSGFGEVVADKMVGQIDMYDLMKAALRQRPEYIIVGEIRGREAYVLFQAMATGHATYSTVHADSAQSLIHRLEGKPINIPRVMLQSLDVVSLHVITRVKNTRARRCKQIIEIIDIDPTTKEILTNEVFRWDPIEDIFVYSGKSYVLERIRAEKDLSREDIGNEIRNRTKLIEWMNKSNIIEFREVAKTVSQYNENPSETLKQIERVVKK